MGLHFGWVDGWKGEGWGRKGSCYSVDLVVCIPRCGMRVANDAYDGMKSEGATTGVETT